MTRNDITIIMPHCGFNADTTFDCQGR